MKKRPIRDLTFQEIGTKSKFSVENIENFNDFEETIDKFNDFEETIETFNGFKKTIEFIQWFWRTLSPLNVFDTLTIANNGFSMVLGSPHHWFQWFSMVRDHWSNDGMVSMDRTGLPEA